MATSSTDLPSEVQWPSFVALQELSQLRKVCRSNHQTCDQLLRQRYREIQATFVAIAHRAGDVLDRLPEELLEEDEEEAQASEQLWDLMSWVREKAKGLLELLEVTRDKCPDTEVVNGDVPHQILAEIVARAELEARGGTRNARTSHGGTRNARTSHGGTRNARTSHVEAACSFIHATRQVEELLRPILAPRLGSGLHSSSIVLHPPMNPPSETESAYSVTENTQSRTRPSQPPQFPGTITEDTGGPGPEDSALPESMPGGADLAELQELEHQLLEARARQPGDSQELAIILGRLGQVKRNLGHQAEAIEHLKESLRMQRSLQGDIDHPGIAATLHELGDVTAQTG
ncbi:unnamed protein product, partial [Durusdinium trenchii]